MSRHFLQPSWNHPSKLPLEIVIGWDPPLRTYFAQVFQPQPHEWTSKRKVRAVCEWCATMHSADLRAQECPARDPDEILWRGFGLAAGDVLTLEEAEKLLEPYATVPANVHAELLQDERQNR